MHDKIKAAIDKISGGKPIKYLINTHFHGDHTGGNGPFHKDGTTIVAHKNLALRLEARFDERHVGRQDGTGREGLDSDPRPIPRHRLAVDGRGPKRRGGQSSGTAPTPTPTLDVYFAAADVIAPAATRSSLGNRYPTIDYANGGSLNGIIGDGRNLSQTGRRSDEVRAGSRPASHKKAVIENYHDMLVSVRDRVEEALRRGQDRAGGARRANPLAELEQEVGGRAGPRHRPDLHAQRLQLVPQSQLEHDPEKLQTFRTRSCSKSTRITAPPAACAPAVAVSVPARLPPAEPPRSRG